ncbi:MAG: hypothetical protein Q4D52_02385 [Eubacteriales bacterium]|nr:hypothetical protein [Eubacteriales bacterium]
MKKRKLLLEGLLIATLALSACHSGNERKAEGDKASVSTMAVETKGKTGNKTEKQDRQTTKADKKYVPKQVKYQKDETTQVLVDADIQAKDIVKIVQHGDHWHVFTNDGRERITYQDPTALLSEQSGGQSTDSPTKTANHSAQQGGLVFISVVSLADLKGLPVSQIKVHGDHWHVYLQDGTEYLTYENPGHAFPHITITEYVGNHGSSTANQNSTRQLNYVHDRQTPPQPKPNDVKPQGPSDQVQNWDPNRVVKILQHEDHYHVYTADGREFISYIDPRPFYPDAEFGQYIGSHGDGMAQQPGQPGDQPQRPDVQKPQPGQSASQKPDGKKQDRKKPDASKPQGSKPGQQKPTPQKPGGLYLVTVVDLAGLKKLDVEKILQHDDHYHVYTKDKKEYITYHDPRSVFPKMKIGTYTGRHGHQQSNQGQQGNQGNQSKPGNQNKPGQTGNQGRTNRPSVKPIVQDPKDPKRIVRIAKHNDHWHLISADGTEQITYDDPQALYPDIKIEDYLGEHLKPVDPNELFSYDDVEAELIIPEKALDWYGGMQYAIDFDPIKEEFIVPHLDHFHNISIKTIIGLAKDGKTFKQYTARQVVATLKYWVTHPQERPKKAGWGDQTGQIDEGPAEDYRETELKLAFLRKHYGITSKSDYLRIRDAVEIYVGEETVKVYLSDLKVENGQVIPTVELPKIEKRKVPWPTEENEDKTEETEDKPEDKSEENGDQKDEIPSPSIPAPIPDARPDSPNHEQSADETEDEEPTVPADDEQDEDDRTNDDQADEDGQDETVPSGPSEPGNQAELEQAAAMYGISVGELEELFLEVVPDGSIYQAVFHEDQTVTIGGQTYDLKEALSEMKGEVMVNETVAPAMDEDNQSEAAEENAEAGEDSSAIEDGDSEES